VDVEAEPALGSVVCSSGVDGNWRSVLRQSAEGAERGDAAGELHGDVQRHGERRDDKYSSDSVHGGIKEDRSSRQAFWNQTGVMSNRWASNASRRTKRPMVRNSSPARE